MIRAGIIGLGVGEAHIEGYNSHPDCRVSAICDFNPDVLNKMSGKYPDLLATSDPKDILTNESIDVVSIASYDNFHHPQILLAIENDKHIFVEKPLCLFRNEAEQIYDALHKKPYLKISSNLILRQSERFIHLKQMIDDGKLGEIFYISGSYNYGRIHKIIDGWRGKLDFYSVIYGGGVHILDLFQWILDEKPEEVFAYGNNIATKDSSFTNDDLVAGVLKYKNGITAQLTCNFACVHPHFHQFEVYGTEGTFINGMEHALFFDSREQEKPKKIDTPYPGVKKGDLLYDFIEAILRGREPKVSKKDIFAVTSTCFAMEDANKTGKPVKVDYL